MKTTDTSGTSGTNDGKVNENNKLDVGAIGTSAETQVVRAVPREGIGTTWYQCGNASGTTLRAKESLLKQVVAGSGTTRTTGTTNFKAHPPLSGLNAEGAGTPNISLPSLLWLPRGN
jgi:hypothetical protein